VGAELGISGLCLFVAIIVGAFIALGRLTRSDRAVDSDTGLNRRALTHALTGSLVGFVVGAYFLSLAYSEMFYTLLAMSVGLCKVPHTPWSPYD
jgi:O-antigen ligase